MKLWPDDDDKPRAERRSRLEEFESEAWYLAVFDANPPKEPIVPWQPTPYDVQFLRNMRIAP